MPYAPRAPRPAVSEFATYKQSLTTLRYTDPRGLGNSGPKRLGPFLGTTVVEKNRLVVDNFRSAGVHTPDFHRKVEEGVFISPTAANGRRSINGLPVGEMSWDGGSVIAFYSGAQPFLGGTFGSLSSTTQYHGFDSSLPNRALIKCRLKLKDQAVNFAQAFAERRQTAELLEDTLKKFYRCISNLRRARFRAAVAALELPGSATRRLSRDKTAASNWLALQYGWLPLMSDLYGSFELLRSRDEYDPLRYRLYVKAGAVSSFRFLPVYETHAWIRPQDVNRSGLVHKKAKVRLDYNLDDGRILSLAKSAGFINPLLLAWELTPFSFVADWAFPFGNFLSQLDATIGMIYLGGSLTERWEARCSARYLQLGSATDWLAFNFGAAREDSAWRRTPYSSEPFPALPSFKDPLSATHVANAAALISALRSVTR